MHMPVTFTFHLSLAYSQNTLHLTDLNDGRRNNFKALNTETSIAALLICTHLQLHSIFIFAEVCEGPLPMQLV